MNYLIFDTETTGLPKGGQYNAEPSEVDVWPRVVQLAFCLFNKTGVIMEAQYIIKPEGYYIPADSTDIHGITNEHALNGVSMEYAINEFVFAMGKAHILIGHNVNFDRKVIGAELIRLGQEDVLHGFPKGCTMGKSTNVCKLSKPSGKGGFKWASLQELHKFLFDVEFKGEHNAMVDVLATKRCFARLANMGVFNVKYFIDKLEKAIGFGCFNHGELEKEVELLKGLSDGK